MSLIETGAMAPDFTAFTSAGVEVRLQELLRNGNVMLVFYPKDFTPGCTDQLVDVRNSIDLIRGFETEPFGVNPADAESHEKFRRTYEMPFALLVDEHRTIEQAYGSVTDEGGTKRSVVVIGTNGKVIFAREGAPAWNEIRQSLPVT